MGAPPPRLTGHTVTAYALVFLAVAVLVEVFGFGWAAFALLVFWWLDRAV